MGKIYKNGIEYGGGGGDSAGHIILDNDGTAMAEEPNLQFKGLNVTDNSTDEITEVESVGLNQDSMDDVLNASIPGNQVASNGLVYSTEEQVVGKWIDGKPLYQITIYSSASYTLGTSYYDTEIADLSSYNISQVVEPIIGYTPSWSGQKITIPMSVDTAWVDFWLNTNSLRFRGQRSSGSTVITGLYATLKYTKTTD